MTAREYNRRIKQAIAALKAAGAARVLVEICENGTARVVEAKDDAGDEFRAVRALAFPGDARQFLDLRRSAATEARRGGATRDDLGKAMANRVDASDALAKTYLLDASDRVSEARKKARG